MVFVMQQVLQAATLQMRSSLQASSAQQKEVKLSWKTDREREGENVSDHACSMQVSCAPIYPNTVLLCNRISMKKCWDVSCLLFSVLSLFVYFFPLPSLLTFVNYTDCESPWLRVLWKYESNSMNTACMLHRGVVSKLNGLTALSIGTSTHDYIKTTAM